MTWTECVIDATMGARDGMFCFCPVERDEHGQITSVISGLNFLGAPPTDMRFIGVIHEDGQAAVEEFCAEHETALAPFIGDAA